MKLSTLTDERVELAKDYIVVLPPRHDYLVVTAGATYPEAGIRFQHRNVAATQHKVFETRAYWPSGRKKWFQHAGINFHFIIPGDAIELVENKTGYSYVPTIIGDEKYNFNVSGGTAGGLWIDRLRQSAHIGIGFSQKKLKKLADLALPPAEYQGIQHNLVNIDNREKARFVELVASYQVRADFKKKKTAKIYLIGEKAPRSVILPYKGREFIVMDGGGRSRVRHTYVNWTKTAQINEIPLPDPNTVNHVGEVLN